MYKNTKFIFVTGGVLSSLGKGLSAASIGTLLESWGYSITLMKMDPYLNVDPGTMNPYQHGEVYVTHDGAETDLDLGHYERFTSIEVSKRNNLTAGMVYESVLNKERKGDYLGSTVQIIPHVTDEIKERIKSLAEKVDFVIVELGGTVGDIEGLPFLEAVRQMPTDVGKQNVIFIHVTLLPYMKKSEEIKTKPTQHSVSALMRVGITPDIIICRTEKEINKEIRKKIALFCNVLPKHVIEAKDVNCIYEVPLNFHKEELDIKILELFGLWPTQEQDLKDWQRFITRVKNIKDMIHIGMVGKYSALPESYKSLNEALMAAGWANNINIIIHHINTDHPTYYETPDLFFKNLDGIVVPGGFGSRGTEEKIKAIQYARENKIPFLGICLGMQLAVVEFARNVCGMVGANSTEFDPNTKYPIIDLLPEQKNIKDKGATMRLGDYECQLNSDTKAFKAYKQFDIIERHRHRYEVNPDYEAAGYIKQLSETGLRFSGIHLPGAGPDLAEIIELPEDMHPWFVGVQFHPEFTSKPLTGHPLFNNFIKACIEQKIK